MRRGNVWEAIGLFSIVASVGSIASAQDNRTTKNPWERKIFFGEQHLHTSASPDAFAVGTRATWDDAYRYEMGQEVALSTIGETWKSIS